MGGKGGGGGGSANPADYGMVWDPTGMAGTASGDPGPMTPTGGWVTQAEYDAKYPKAAPAAAVQEAAPAAAPAEAPAPAPEPEPTVAPPDPTPMGPAIGAGGAITQPTAGGNNTSANSGDVLGGAVLKPPNYWVGGISTPTSGRGSGRLTTTQT